MAAVTPQQATGKPGVRSMSVQQVPSFKKIIKTKKLRIV